RHSFPPDAQVTQRKCHHARDTTTAQLDVALSHTLLSYSILVSIAQRDAGKISQFGRCVEDMRERRDKFPSRPSLQGSSAHNRSACANVPRPHLFFRFQRIAT